MYTSVTRRTTLSTALALLCLLLATDVRAQQALNTNGSLENTAPGVITDLTGGLEGWVLEVSADITDAPEFAVVDDVAYEGDQSLRVAVDEAGTSAWHIQAVATEIPVVPGEDYTFSVWARMASGTGTAAFTVGNADFDEYGALRDNVTLTEEWEEFTFDFTVTDEETVIRAPIHFSFEANAGNLVYIDNLRVFDPDAPDLTALPVIVQAESGTLGNEWETVEADTVTYIAITTDYDETTGTGDYPGENRTASYEVTFPGSGYYDLFARIYVGSGTFDDDSFFYADSLGEQDPAVAEDWIVANQLASAGFTEPEEFVSGLGAATEGAWKWVNLSENNFNDVPSDSFFVPEGDLTHTFEIGAREDGLWFDKLAFGRSDLFYTVASLDEGTAGAEDMGGGEVTLPEEPLAAGLDKFLGNVYSGSQVENFEYYWNQVTPENSGKWGSVESTRDEMDWGALDAAYDLAQDNGYPFRFHVLVWGNQQPEWIADLPDDEQREEIREWFEAVNERYPDIEYLEVVNEPLHDPPDGPEDGGYIEALGGSGETGWDWIITAFEMADEIFPEDTQLMLNDYGILGNPSAATEYRYIAELLQERGLIDAIGVQGHAFSTRSSASSLTSVLDILGATGLPLMVTEMDVDGNPSVGDITEEESDQNQLEAMQRIFPALWEHPSLVGITLWGWRPGLWRQDEEAYLVQADGTPRPALIWLQEYLDAYESDTEPGEELASSAQLLGNQPNPFGTSTQIAYTLDEAAEVTLEVYDALGRRVETLVTAYQTPGDYTVTFDASRQASGLYLYRLRAGSHVESRPMTVVK